MSLIFSIFWHGARMPCEVVRERAGFSVQISFGPQNWENGPKMSQKQGKKFFHFIVKHGH